MGAVKQFGAGVGRRESIDGERKGTVRADRRASIAGGVGEIVCAFVFSCVVVVRGEMFGCTGTVETRQDEICEAIGLSSENNGAVGVGLGSGETALAEGVSVDFVKVELGLA